MPKAKRKTISKKNKRPTGDGCLPQNKTVVAAKNGDKGRFIVDNHGSAVELLPPEVLELIFKNVENPKDLLSCWKATDATSAWATALRTTDFYFKMTLPFIMSYFGRDDLLNCSSVSKCWNATVDSCIEYAEDFNSNQKVYTNTYIQFKQRIVNELEAGRLPDFIHRFGSGVAISPVPFRHTEVNIYLYKTPIGKREREEQQQQHPNEVPLSFVRNNLIKCFDHHGHLIRHLELTFHDYDGPEANSKKELNLIRLCLKHTPNLRSLYISAHKDTIPDFQVSKSNYKWPPLAHLKVLRFADFTNRTAFANIANAYAPQLVHLQFEFKLMKPHRPLSNQFSCLQKIDYTCYEVGSEMEFAAFIQGNQCPLKHLSIIYSWFDDGPDLEGITTGLLNAANAASATLETLSFYPDLSGSDEINLDITKLKGLRLPRLKELDLTDFDYPSLELLQSVCPSLQTLYLHPNLPRDVCPAMPNSEIYAHLYSEHNFWSELGNIQQVDVKYMVASKIVVVDKRRKGAEIKREIEGGIIHKVYTRSKYDAIVEKKRAIRIDGEENQSSSEEEYFLKPCLVKAPHGGRPRKLIYTSRR